MNYLIIGLLLVFLVFRHLDKSMIRPSNMFIVVWLSISVLFSLKYIEYNNPSNYTYLLIFVGVLSFAIGGRFSIKPKLRVERYEIDIRKVIVLQILTIIVYVPETIDTIRDLIAGQTLEDVRLRAGEETGSSGLIAILKNFVLTPFLFLSYPITAYIFFTTKTKGNKKQLVLLFSMILVAISVLRLGGRSPILFFLVNFFVVWYFYKDSVVLSRSVKHTMILVVCVAVLSFVYASISRGIEDLPRSFYHYFVGCVALLDNGVKSVNFITGVILLCFMYGMLSDSIYKAAIYNRHFITIVIFSLIVQGVIFSFIRFQFATFYYFMAFLIIPLIIKRKQVL